MRATRLLLFLAATALSGSTFAAAPKLPGIGAAMEEMIAKNEIAGAVTVVLAKDKLLHLESTGLADVATQSGINLAGRIVEVVSGMSFDAFLQKRLFDPLGMKDTTFYPTEAHRLRLATGYAKNRETGALEPASPRREYGARDRPPQGDGGLFSTPNDYARFTQMLLNRGVLDGKRYLSEAAFTTLTTVHTGELPTGFFQSETHGKRLTRYGWGIGTAIQKAPHEGVAEMLSPGTFGHGGAWGTQAWIDPVKGVAYLLFVQRSNFPNSDASEVRRVFQRAAADALRVRRTSDSE